MSLTLYAAPMSSATPVVTAVAELGIDCEVVLFDLKSGEQKKPDYLALNPHGVVPTLVVDGTPLYEAVAIMQWLGDRYGVERDLWPAAGTPERLQALSWSTWAYVSYGALVVTLNFAQSPLVDASLHHPATDSAALQRLDEALGRLDAHLARSGWIVGDAYSLADLIVGGVVAYSGFCGVQTDGHPHLSAWLQQIQARPAFRKTWA